MIPALIIINDKLLETGMNQVEIDHLMARFLEEEAQDYVDCLNEFIEKHKQSTVLH